MFGRCRVCLEKENRIHDLQEQVTLLRKLAFPSLDKDALRPSDAERDMLLSGNFGHVDSDPINVTITAEQLEAASLLTGSYDHSQVNVVD